MMLHLVWSICNGVGRVYNVRILPMEVFMYDHKLMVCRMAGRAARADSLPCVSPYVVDSEKDQHWRMGWNEGHDFYGVERVDNQKLSREAAISIARSEGVIDGSNNVPLSDCKYNHWTPLYDAYSEGWVEGQKKRAEVVQEDRKSERFAAVATWLIIGFATYGVCNAVIKLVQWL